MQFLSVSQRRKGFAEEAYAGLAEQEMERARELYSEGLIRQIWHRCRHSRRVLVVGSRERRTGSRSVEDISVCRGRHDGDDIDSTKTLRRL